MLKIIQRYFLKEKFSSKKLPLVVLGSSSSEIFDYIFGNNPEYFPYWAGGWSARGLRSQEHEIYLRKIMKDIPKNANILLNFGCADVAFTLRHMAANKGVYDFPKILREAAEGIEKCRRVLIGMGFKRVYAVFVSPMISLPQEYWNRLQPGRQLPDRMLGVIYYDLFKLVSKRMPTINFFDELSRTEDGSYLLKDKYKREKPDHHPDYIKIQRIVYDKLKIISGMMPIRDTLLAEKYPTYPAPIKDLLASGTTRPRTCR